MRHMRLMCLTRLSKGRATVRVETLLKSLLAVVWPKYTCTQCHRHQIFLLQCNFYDKTIFFFYMQNPTRHGYGNYPLATKVTMALIDWTQALCKRPICAHNNQGPDERSARVSCPIAAMNDRNNQTNNVRNSAHAQRFDNANAWLWWT